MSKINENVFAEDKKFIDISGLNHFWTKTKEYVDNADGSISAKVKSNEDKLALIQNELDELNGGSGSITTQIETAINNLNLPNTYATKGELNAEIERVDDLESELRGRIDSLELIDHEKLATDASAAAVATILDNAPASFDTLKEVADWISSNDHAADVATLMTDVENLKKIDHKAYKAADTALETSLKGYVDGKDSAMDVRVKVLEGHDVYVKSDVDSAIADAKKAGTDANAALEAYKPVIEKSVDDAKTAAIAQAKLDAADALQSYYNKTSIDNLLSSNAISDRAYAKQYTDELFDSMKFAADSDIDSLFE